jgi:hypothetical protein
MMMLMLMPCDAHGLMQAKHLGCYMADLVQERGAGTGPSPPELGLIFTHFVLKYYDFGYKQCKSF